MSEIPAAPRRVIPPPVIMSRTDEAVVSDGVVRDVGVVIVAGGSGSRTGSAELKQFRWVAGKPALLHSVLGYPHCPASWQKRASLRCCGA